MRAVDVHELSPPRPQFWGIGLPPELARTGGLTSVAAIQVAKDPDEFNAVASSVAQSTSGNCLSSCRFHRREVISFDSGCNPLPAALPEAGAR